eukprot:gene8441-10368_t
MFSGTYKLKPMKGTTDTFFIDRDGKHFRLILNLLRDGKLVFPEKESHKIELMNEINFYCLNDYLESSIQKNKEIVKEKEKEYIESVNSIKKETQEKLIKINEWAGFSKYKKWNLIYKASRDGFGGLKFHEKCDGKGETITIIKSSNGNEFGGYTSLSWNSAGLYQNDTKSFLFLLNNEKNESMKFPYRSSSSILGNPSFGPTFGNGYDLHICDNSNIKQNSHTNITNTHGYQNTTGNPFILAGSHKFLVDEIQVYQSSIW